MMQVTINAGVWRPTSDCVNVMATDVYLTSPKSGIIAVSYQNGDVRIFNYPCQTYGVSTCITSFDCNLVTFGLQGDYIELPGVATQSSRMRFSLDGASLVVLDAFTRSIIRYNIKY
jgi:hypothetical protein